MKIKSQRDFWAGLMFLVLGAGFAFGALNYTFGSSARPGPGYFPFGLGVILAALGAFTLFEALTIATEDGEPVGTIAWRPLVIVLGSVAVFGLLLPRLGMLIALPVLVVLSSTADRDMRWPSTLVSAVVLTVSSYLIFNKGLGLTIPVLPAFMG